MFTTILLYALGYCTFAWVLAFCLFLFTNVLRGAHPMIVVWAPALPFFLTLEKLEEVREALHRKRMQGVSRFIVKELRKNSITVRGEFGIRRRDIRPDDDYEITANGFSWLGDGCEVFAEVAPHQHHAYGAVFGLAIRKFTWLTPKQICAKCYPQEPLDRHWAAREGCAEYFAEEHYVPCEDCGTEDLWHSLEWGNDKTHSERWARVTTYHPRDCTKKSRTVSGHICRDCSRKIGWNSSSGGAFYKVPATTTDGKTKTA